MSDDRELHTLARELFAAARTEGPEAVARERARSAVLAAYDRPDEEDDAEETHESHEELGKTVVAHRRKATVWGLAAVAATLAVAAGWALLVTSVRDGDGSIAPAPERITDVPKKQGVEPARSVPVVPSGQRAERPPAVPPSVKAPSSARTPPTLSDEVGMLDRARSELRGNGAARALELLDDYERRAGGHLRDEATLLRMEALAGVGRKGEAAELAKRFIESNPTSTLADRARTFLKSGDPKGEGR